MTQDEFKDNVKEWLCAKQGNSCIGIWTLEEKGDDALVKVSLKVNNIEIEAKSLTSSKEETIMTAVLAMNEQLVSKLENSIHKA